MKIINDIGLPKNLDKEEYIKNGIIVMKKYLFPSLERQSCKDFTWILILGNEANITHIKSFFNFKNSFEKIIIQENNFKNYVRKISKGFDILITTRYDYDDRIYYDAVNDIRKEINYNKPMLLYGYNRGFMYIEPKNAYYVFEKDFKGLGVMSVFFSLITILDKVNDTYTILELGNHMYVKKKLLDNYKFFGISKLEYDPAIFDTGSSKFVYVRQKYSSGFRNSSIYKGTKINNFNLNKFYGE